MDTTVDIKKLRIIPCLSNLKDEEVLGICSKSKRQKFKKGEIVFMEGDPVDYLFIVEKGLVKSFKTYSRGKEIIISLFETGEHFCFPVHRAVSKYIVSTATLQDSDIIMIPIEELEKLLNTDACQTSYQIIVGLCRKIHRLSNMIEDITFRNVEQRIVKALIEIALAQPLNEGAVHLSITHQHIAARSGTVREVVARTMGKLKRKGVIFNSSVNGFSIHVDRLLSIQTESKHCHF